MLIVKSILEYPKGTIEMLLVEAYEPLHKEYLQYRDDNYRYFRECDAFFYDNPEAEDNCSFLSGYNENIAGMCSWNPVKYPVAEIGHNCIIAVYKGIGLGIDQMRIAVNIQKDKGFKSALVSIGIMDFLFLHRGCIKGRDLLK